MPYKIKPYSYDQAKNAGVSIKPSDKQNKKIDVYKDDKLVARIGDPKYKDYPSYIESHGLSYANERRRLYRLRHKKDMSIKDSNGYYANKILW